MQIWNSTIVENWTLCQIDNIPMHDSNWHKNMDSVHTLNNQLQTGPIRLGQTKVCFNLEVIYIQSKQQTMNM